MVGVITEYSPNMFWPPCANIRENMSNTMQKLLKFSIKKYGLKSADLLQSTTVHQHITKLYVKVPVFPSLKSVFREK